MAGQWSDVMHETATVGVFKQLLKKTVVNLQRPATGNRTDHWRIAETVRLKSSSWELKTKLVGTSFDMFQ